ncbi:ABC transporter permease [Labrys okinawensis]|uniref:ABC transporter permease n=1 Tax=Labrys okinawensis TaxID=346911 RepID=A0A2S9Q5Y2_9HYPH|nr:ABC transporter permease [Labrys okinawensis]
MNTEYGAVRGKVIFPGLLLGSLVVICLVVGLSVGIGDLPIPLDITFAAVANRLGWSVGEIDRVYETVIWDYRLSRALVAAFCGAGLALSGAIMQSLLRNPLAEPYVLGISAGASTGAVAIIILGIGAGAVSLSAGAFLGAFAAFCFVALLSNGTRGGADRTILAGVAASQLFNAATSYIVTTAGNAQQARDVMFWLLGSFGGVRWPEFMLVSGVVSLGFVACLSYARTLDTFAFGDETAASLGVNVDRARIVLFALTALMTAAIVSMVGSIGFVGLVVPHAARSLIGPLHIRLLPACALIGAIFMVLADVASRALIPQQVLPIGVVTALVGVPCFSVILYRLQRAT